MAHPARPLTPQRDTNDNTGRFAIDSSVRGTMLPPAQPAEEGAADVLSLEELGGTIVESTPRSAPPPPPPARGAIPESGVFRSGEVDPDSAFVERIISLQPIYTSAETAQGERAVLEIEDLSLRPDNPYLASSLVPPTERQAKSAWFVTGAALLALLGGGTIWYLAHAAQSPSAATRPAAAIHARPGAASINAPTSVPTAQQTAAVPADPAVSADTAASNDVAQPIALPSEPVARELAAPKPVVARATAQAPVATVPTMATSAATPAPVTTATPSSSLVAETGAGALPELPTREQVAAGFDAVRPELEICAAGQRGVATLAATVANSGRVTYALIEGIFAGTPEGSCMARAVRNAHFPRFAQPSLKVTYPVSL